MTSVFTARRRAEEFNSLVEASSPEGVSDARYAELLDLISQLREIEPPAPRPEFSVSLREELMRAADTALVPSPGADRLTLPVRQRSRDRRLAVAVGGLAIVGATTSLAVAAQSALPGEMLYPLKRALESAQTQVQTSPQAKADSLLADATTRLQEARELSRGGDLGDTASIASSLDDFAHQAQEGSAIVLDEYASSGDDRAIEDLNTFTARSMDSLARLEHLVPDGARDELLHAARALERIDALAARACPSCAGGIDQIPSVLLAADETTGTTVVVPGTMMPTGEGDAGGAAKPHSGKSDHNGGGSSGSGTGDLTDSLTGGGVTDPGGSTDDTSPIDPLGDVTDTLTGSGGGTTTDNGGLDKTVDDVGKTVDDTVDDVTDGLDDVTDGITDGLP